MLPRTFISCVAAGCELKTAKAGAKDRPFSSRYQLPVYRALNALNSTLHMLCLFKKGPKPSSTIYHVFDDFTILFYIKRIFTYIKLPVYDHHNNNPSSQTVNRLQDQSKYSAGSVSTILSCDPLFLYITLPFTMVALTSPLTFLRS